MVGSTADTPARCSRCGLGELVDIGFDEGARSEVPDGVDVPWQGADTRQVETYSCGHQVIGPRLSLADADRMDVERRSSDDTVAAPLDAGDGSGTAKGRAGDSHPREGTTS